MVKCTQRYTSTKYSLAIALIFSVIIAVSLALSIRQIDSHARAKALTEAKAIFDLNLAYRLWNARHGGVYVPVTERYQPSPYLAVHPKRDITATDGTVLTVVNPAIMTRSVHEILSQRSALPILNKVTSLKYFNPANKPDAWEEKALRSFEQGATEADEVVLVDGRPYLRLLMPYYTEEGCLKCHAWQGYKLGDVRGGLSVGVPMQPHLEIAAVERRNEYLTHALIWMFGMCGIAMFGVLLQRSEKKIIESESKFRTLAESSSDWVYWHAEDGSVLFTSPSCREITGYGPDEFMNDPGLVTRIIHPEDREAWDDHLDRSRSLKERFEIVCRITTKSGGTKWLSHICDPIISGEVMIGRRVSCRDITEKIVTEEELRRWLTYSSTLSGESR